MKEASWNNNDEFKDLKKYVARNRHQSSTFFGGKKVHGNKGVKKRTHVHEKRKIDPKRTFFRQQGEWFAVFSGLICCQFFTTVMTTIAPVVQNTKNSNLKIASNNLRSLDLTRS